MGLGEREGYPDDPKILVSATVGELPSPERWKPRRGCGAGLEGGFGERTQFSPWVKVPPHNKSLRA